MTTETNDLILKIIGGVLVFFSLRWLKNIFAGADKKLTGKELGHLTGFIIFVWAFIYMVIKEANRANPSDSNHIFNDIWLFFVLSGLLTVLHLGEILDKFIILRSGTTTTVKKETSTETKTIKKEDEIL